MRTAFTRAVSPRLAECQLTHLRRTPIDAAKAAQQHATYEAILRKAGFDVVRLPELADDPDAVFVEDTALILGDHAVITRPGAASRIGEIDSTAEGLNSHFGLHWIRGGHLDGGDVIRIDQTLYVGLSTRTDEIGIASLQSLAAPLGYTVVQADLRDCLHLKTGATFAGRDGTGTPVLLHDPRSVDPVQFARTKPLAVHESESAAANCLRAGDHLILPASNPRTADMLRNRGFTVIEVDVSELQKAESGVTCMSLIAD